MFIFTLLCGASKGFVNPLYRNQLVARKNQFCDKDQVVKIPIVSIFFR